MPLLNGQAWKPDSLSAPPEASDDAQVFFVRQTGEIFSAYEEYKARLRLLQSRQWSSNGRSGLNYEEAVQEDKRAELLLSEVQYFLLLKAALARQACDEKFLAPKLLLKKLCEFPEELEEPAVRAAHHSLLPLDELVNKIHSSHCSPTGSGKENLPGEDAGGKALDVPQDSIRCWLVRATRNESHGGRSLWVANPEYQRRYRLAEQVPQDIAVEVERTNTNEQVAKGTGELAAPSPEAEGPPAGIDTAAPGLADVLRRDTDAVPPVTPLAEEIEKLKDGTHKHALVHVLRDAGADGMAVAQILETAKQKGLRDYEPSHRKLAMNVLIADPAFVRVTKGVYALRALMGDKPFEAIGGLNKQTAKPKRPEADAAAPAPKAQATDKAKVAGAAAPAKKPALPSPKRQREGEGLDDAYVRGAATSIPLLSLEEEEQRMAPGTVKETVFRVLKLAGSTGMTVQEIMSTAKDAGLRDFSENQRGGIATILICDTAFVRLRKGVYALRALVGDAPCEVMGRASKRARAEGGSGAATGASPAKQGHEGGQQAGPAAGSRCDEQEVESRSKNEQIEAAARQMLEKHQQALKRAIASQQRARLQMDQAGREPSTPKKGVPDPASGPRPSLDLTHEQKRFIGDPDSEADVAAHRARLAGLTAAKEAALREWEAAAGTETSAAAAAAAATDARRRAERTLRSAEKRVLVRAEDVAAAEAELREAAKALHKERAKAAADEKRAEDRRLREEARLAERERKRAEALEAKRYPMEDLQLLQELKDKAAAAGEPAPEEDVPLPDEWLSEEDSGATADLLFIADLAAQFPRAMRVRCPPYQDLGALLEGSIRPGDVDAEPLWELYSGLLRLLLQDSGSSAKSHRWLPFLESGTMSEVLKRYLDARLRQIPETMSMNLAELARQLALGSLDDLSGEHHQALLRFLCDDALDGPSLRNALQQRLDDSDDVKREMRGAVAEKKGELKELLEAEKEERRKKREEQAARKAKEEALKKAQGEAKEANDGAATDAADAEAAGPEPQQAEDAAVERPDPPSQAGDADAEEAEPSWELPPELAEFRGDPMDRKGMLEFRQTQQAARQRLEKEKEKWQVAARQRAKEREARLRAAADAERAKVRAKLAAEEEVIRQQEAYERELEKFNIRRAPLGEDRRQRKYWWGAAGQRAHVYVEDAAGRWGVLASRQQLDALLAALDTRGVREQALHAALDKAYSSIVQAMKRSESKAAAEDRFPKRERAQAAVFSPSKEAARQQRMAKHDVQAAVGGLTGAALALAVKSLSQLHSGMAKSDVEPPKQGWKSWANAFRTAAKDAAAAYSEEGSLGSIVAALKTCLLEAEDMLSAVSEDSSSSDDGADSSRDPSEEPADGGSETRRHAKLWPSVDERVSWRVSVMGGETVALVAFAASQLAAAGAKLLARLDRLKSDAKRPAERPKGGAKGGAAAKKAAKASEPATAPNGVSKSAAKKTAALARPADDTTGAKKVAAKAAGASAPPLRKVTRNAIREAEVEAEDAARKNPHVAARKGEASCKSKKVSSEPQKPPTKGGKAPAKPPRNHLKGPAEPDPAPAKAAKPAAKPAKAARRPEPAKEIITRNRPAKPGAAEAGGTAAGGTTARGGGGAKGPQKSLARAEQAAGRSKVSKGAETSNSRAAAANGTAGQSKQPQKKRKAKDEAPIPRVTRSRAH